VNTFDTRRGGGRANPAPRLTPVGWADSGRGERLGRSSPPGAARWAAQPEFRIGARPRTRTRPSEQSRQIVGRNESCARRWRRPSCAEVECGGLLLGRPGVAREIRSSHHECGRADGPFGHVEIAVGLPRDILPRLFGYVEGAFTGARRSAWSARSKRGPWNVVLDEIGEMPLDLQPYFLRVLEAGKYTRSGTVGRGKVEFRLVGHQQGICARS